MDRAAPMKAATAIGSPLSSDPSEKTELLPLHITAIAAPNAAPELTPIICGSAREFLSMLCICTPAKERDAPAMIAVTVRGIRRYFMTSRSAGP